MLSASARDAAHGLMAREGVSFHPPANVLPQSSYRYFLTLLCKRHVRHPSFAQPHPGRAQARTVTLPSGRAR